MSDRLYDLCEIFVDAPGEDAVADVVATVLGGKFDSYHNMDLPGLWIDVRHNPQWVEESGDFLLWRVRMELCSHDLDAEQRVVSAVSRVLAALWDAGHRAVASCDFEDELPWRGGITRIHERADG